MGDQKQSNPKDAIGCGKLPMGLVPDIVPAACALAMLEGSGFYGRYNYRVIGVRSSIYHDALRRHLAKWWNGQDADPKTKVPHLASVIACAGIILDAELCGKLTDDRPPSAPMAEWIDKQREAVAHLREMFKDHEPRQYTIHDTRRADMLDNQALCDWIAKQERRSPDPALDDTPVIREGEPVMPWVPYDPSPPREFVEPAAWDWLVKHKHWVQDQEQRANESDAC